jgi:hypothetical protein
LHLVLEEMEETYLACCKRSTDLEPSMGVIGQSCRVEATTAATGRGREVNGGREEMARAHAKISV